MFVFFVATFLLVYGHQSVTTVTANCCVNSARMGLGRPIQTTTTAGRNAEIQGFGLEVFRSRRRRDGVGEGVKLITL